jgi:hypothetical protein
MKTLIAFIALSWSILGYAENTQTLKCRVKNPEWEAAFRLTNADSGFLEFKRLGINNSYVCGLKGIRLTDLRGAVVPNVKVEFERSACNPELGELEQEIFDKFLIIVDLRSKDISSRVQWLKRKQPDNCVNVEINMFGISMNQSGLKE